MVFGVVATVVTRANVDDNTVYEVVRSVMENIETLRKQHPILANLEPKSMTQKGLSAPLHPGAIRYYKEKGLL